MNIKLDVLEKYVDKLVLGIAGIACLAILWFFVIQSPKAEIYGRTYGPGEIDSYVQRQAKMLEENLGRDPEPKEYASKIDVFLGSFAQTVDMPNDAVFPLPGKGSQVTAEDRIYDIPSMPMLADAQAGKMRTVVFMPQEPVDKEHPYETVKTDYADIDLVTVQADFDVESLYREFQEKFNGPGVQRDWRDPSLAEPVFAAVELERQTLENGSWSDWEEVPFTKVNNFKELLEVPADVSEIPYGGVDLLKVKLGIDEIQKTILQPFSYELATPAQEWFPPEWQARADEYFANQREEERRRERGLERQRRNARNNRGAPGGMMAPGMMPPGMGGEPAPRRREANNRGREEETIEDIREEFDGVLVEDVDSLASLREPLTVWAFDDTVQPGKSYRYRLRVGVLNPIAGKNWFAQGQKDLQDDVVLWSSYSNATDSIEVQPMVHIFPQNVADSDKTASVEVAKFYYGNWRMESFDTRVGEAVGEIVKIGEEDEDNDLGMGGMGYGMSPVTEVDYTTGDTLVDIARTTKWTSSSALRSSECDEIICSDQQGVMHHLPVGRRNWSDYMQKIYSDISNLASDEFELYKSRGQGDRRKGRERRPAAPQQMPPGMLPPGMMPPGM